MLMRLLWLALAICFCFSATAPDPSAATGRRTMELDAGWRFHRGGVADAASPGFDDANWDKVTLPHSFNGADGETPDYYRGPAWYRRTFMVGHIQPGRRLYVEFDGAATSAQVFLNGTPIGRHDGGHARFRFDLTSALRTGANLLAVRVDNPADETITPLGGDFTVFGGLYRAVRLVETDDLHIDMADFGGPGVYVRTARLDAATAQLEIRARITNASAAARQIPVSAAIRDAAGRTVSSREQQVSIEPGATLELSLPATLSHPRRWDGVRDPYLYTVEVSVAHGGDAVSVPFGVRDIRIDPARGMILNGRPYAVHGVNLMASARPGKGTAVTPDEVDEDFDILRDMGSTGVRLVHFQHGPEAYAAADRLGLVAWTEIGINSRVSDTPEFRANAEQQLRELIAQNYNHPSVALWGIGNEVYSEDPAVARLLADLNAVAHRADPGRPTVYAHCCQSDDHPKARVTDMIGFNRYFGWYPDAKGSLGAWAKQFHAAHPDKPFAISEYGAGASVLHQQTIPTAPVPASGWHPEGFQTRYHEQNWREIEGLPYIFAKFVWVGFDLASAGRHEGDRRGINDKGLVTYDRKVRKDAWYWYQANWSAAPMLHIVGRRDRNRETAENEIEVFSNLPLVTLHLNGAALAGHRVTGHVARWTIRLEPGPNRIEATAASPRGPLHDAVSLTLSPPPTMIGTRNQPGEPPR